MKDTAISPLSENATRAKFPTNQTALNVSGAEYFLESEQKTNNSKPSLSEGENEIEETPDAERDASLQKLRVRIPCVPSRKSSVHLNNERTIFSFPRTPFLILRMKM